MAQCALIITLLTGSAGYVPHNNFALTITIYTISNQKLWTYTLDMKSISVTRHSLNNEPDLLLHQHALSLKQIKNLDRFLARYPFDRLEKYYINERVHGDTGTVYCIRINRSGKEVYVYYARPGTVLELNRFINKLLPRHLHLWDETL
jgi:hypothetical protein